MSRITKDNIALMSPSELLRCALTDLMRCNNDPLYNIEMGSWHSPHTGGSNQCDVCLAGSVMAQSLGANAVHWLMPANYKGEVQAPLLALDSMRMGSVGAAFHQLGLNPEQGRNFSCGITPWEISPTNFLVQMFQLADDLDAAGY